MQICDMVAVAKIMKATLVLQCFNEVLPIEEILEVTDIIEIS